VLEAIRKFKLKNSKNHFCIIAVYLPTYNYTGIWNYSTFETTCKTSCAVQYLTSLITLKARASVPGQCKIDDIGRGMGTVQFYSQGTFTHFSLSLFTFTFIVVTPPKLPF